MYYDDHNPPHFHAAYEGLEAVFDLEGDLLKGHLSARTRSLVREWCGLHGAELRENWQRAMDARPLSWIEPLS